MIPYLKTQIAEAFTPETQRAIVREYLQMRILHSLQSAGAMIPLAFHGEQLCEFYTSYHVIQRIWILHWNGNQSNMIFANI